MLARLLCVCRDWKEWTGVLQPFVPGGQPLDPDNLGRVLAAFTPEGAIVGNEAATTGLVWNAVHADQD